jgi:hypothetical protein
MKTERATDLQQQSGARLARALPVGCAVLALAGVASVLAACSESPPEPAVVASQPAQSAVCKSQPEDCPWSMNSGKNNSCIDSALGQHRRWRCWKKRSK